MRMVLLGCLLFISSALLTGCGATREKTREVAYKSMYQDKPLSILIMPPINRSTNVEAKEFFHATLNTSFANAGFYVLPPFLSMEILKRESAYDAELFLNSNLEKFGEVFGADLAIFTIIHKWSKTGLTGMVVVEVEYLLKSTKTSEVVFQKRGTVSYDASITGSMGGLAGLMVDVAATALNTALIRQVDIAHKCNDRAFTDLPRGRYSPEYGLDAGLPASPPTFRFHIKPQKN